MNSILENIDTIRRNRGYSQEYLAMQIGMKQAGFSLIMSGERELKYNTLLQIANALQMSVIDVITFPDKYVMAKGNGTSTEAVLQIKLDSDKKRSDIEYCVWGTDCGIVEIEMISFWHGRRGSNSRHLVLETSALPTELLPCLRVQR